MRANKRNSKIGIVIVGLTLMLFTFHLLSPAAALAASASQIDRDARAALADLYKKIPGAKALGDKAVAVLVFPSIVKGGFIIAGQFGDGALRKGGKTTAYYRSLAASYGFQAGVQAFGYVLFFMDDASLQYLDKTAGFEVGVGPSLVVLDDGFGKNYVDDNPAKRCVCIHLRPEGTDGRHGYPGNEDYQNQPITIGGTRRKGLVQAVQNVQVVQSVQSRSKEINDENRLCEENNR